MNKLATYDIFLVTMNFWENRNSEFSGLGNEYSFMVFEPVESKSDVHFCWLVLNLDSRLQNTLARVVSIELTHGFELSPFPHQKMMKMPGIHTNDVLPTHSLLILALEMTDWSFLDVKLDGVR